MLFFVIINHRVKANSLEQLVAMIDSAGRVTNYDRCLCGELKGIIDPLLNHTSWNQDIEGRPISKSFPDGSTIAYGYENRTSRLKIVTDAHSQSANYIYNADDTLNQMYYMNAAVATPTVSYVYDPVYPRLGSMTDGTGTTNFAYKAVWASGAAITGGGRLQTETGPLGSTAAIAYTYDQLGRVTGTAVNSVSSSVTFDSLGRVTNATNPLGSFTYGYYGVTPRLQTLSYPNGQSTSYSYGTNLQDFRLSDITNYKTGTTVLSKNDYTYSAVGEILTWQQQLDSSTPTKWSYQYDGADQLLNATKTNTSTQAVLAQYVYGYDAGGNRSKEQIGLSVTSSTYNNLNQLTGQSGGGPLTFTGSMNKPGTVTVAGNSASVDANNNFTGTTSVSAGTNNVPVVATNLNGYAVTNKYQVVVPASSAVTPTYDINGNLTNNGHGQAYTWDARNELISITYTGGATTTFIYDGRERRVKIVEKNSGGTITSTKQLLWIDDEIAEERDATGTNVTKRFFDQGEQIGTSSYYYTFDHLNSVREMTNSSGTIVARYDYDPYGRVTKISGSLDSDFQYAGYYDHAASGLNFTKYRAYDPNTAKWLSRDPIAERGGINLYGYVANNAIYWSDTLGLSPVPYDSKRSQKEYNPNQTKEEKYRSILDAQKKKGRNNINSTEKSRCRADDAIKPHNLPGEDDDDDLAPPEEPAPPKPPVPPEPAATPATPETPKPPTPPTTEEEPLRETIGGRPIIMDDEMPIEVKIETSEE